MQVVFSRLAHAILVKILHDHIGVQGVALIDGVEVQVGTVFKQVKEGLGEAPLARYDQRSLPIGIWLIDLARRLRLNLASML